MRIRLCPPLAAVALVALAGLPAGATAKGGCHQQSPQGNSEAQQYSEVVPGPCGNQPANPGGAGGGTSHGAIPEQTLRQLQSMGPAGQNAASLAQANAPGGPAGKGAGGGNGAQTGAAGGAQGGSDAISGVGKALGGDSGGGGMGLLLPLILAGTLMAGIAYWLVRRRTSTAS